MIFTDSPTSIYHSLRYLEYFALPNYSTFYSLVAEYHLGQCQTYKDKHGRCSAFFATFPFESFDGDKPNIVVEWCTRHVYTIYCNIKYFQSYKKKKNAAKLQDCNATLPKYDNHYTCNRWR